MQQHKDLCLFSLPGFRYAEAQKVRLRLQLPLAPVAAIPGFAHIKDANPAWGSRRSCVPAAGYIPLAQRNLLAYP